MKRELKARDLSANRLALDLSVPSGRITGHTQWTPVDHWLIQPSGSVDIWLDLQSQHEIAVIERERSAEIARRVRPADTA